MVRPLGNQILLIYANIKVIWNTMLKGFKLNCQSMIQSPSSMIQSIGICQLTAQFLFQNRMNLWMKNIILQKLYFFKKKVKRKRSMNSSLKFNESRKYKEQQNTFLVINFQGNLDNILAKQSQLSKTNKKMLNLLHMNPTSNNSDGPDMSDILNDDDDSCLDISALIFQHKNSQGVANETAANPQSQIFTSKISFNDENNFTFNENLNESQQVPNLSLIGGSNNILSDSVKQIHQQEEQQTQIVDINQNYGEDINKNLGAQVQKGDDNNENLETQAQKEDNNNENFIILKSDDQHNNQQQEQPKTESRFLELSIDEHRYIKFHYEYEIVVKMNDQSIHRNVYRRFTDFQLLSSYLFNKHPNIVQKPLPEKESTMQMFMRLVQENKELIEHRKSIFKSFLNQLNTFQILFTDQIWIDFATNEMSFYDSIQKVVQNQFYSIIPQAQLNQSLNEPMISKALNNMFFNQQQPQSLEGELKKAYEEVLKNLDEFQIMQYSIFINYQYEMA